MSQNALAKNAHALAIRLAALQELNAAGVVGEAVRVATQGTFSDGEKVGSKERVAVLMSLVGKVLADAKPLEVKAAPATLAEMLGVHDVTPPAGGGGLLASELHSATEGGVGEKSAQFGQGGGAPFQNPTPSPIHETSVEQKEPAEFLEGFSREELIRLAEEAKHGDIIGKVPDDLVASVHGDIVGQAAGPDTAPAGGGQLQRGDDGIGDDIL